MHVSTYSTQEILAPCLSWRQVAKVSEPHCLVSKVEHRGGKLACKWLRLRERWCWESHSSVLGLCSWRTRLNQSLKVRLFKLRPQALVLSSRWGAFKNSGVCSHCCLSSACSPGAAALVRKLPSKDLMGLRLHLSVKTLLWPLPQLQFPVWLLLPYILVPVPQSP